MTENLINKNLMMFDRMLEDRIDMYGARNTISWLLDNDYTKNDLLALHFSEEDIDYVIAHPEEEYDMR